MKKHVLAPFAALLISVTMLLAMFCLFAIGGFDIAGLALAAPMQTSPEVTQVDPASAPNDLDIPIVITGTGFTAELSGTLIITPPAAYLGETALANVTWVSSATLEAIVPWGMDPGVYTLTVENPGGEMGSLTNAFTVTPGINVWTTGGPYGGWVESLALGDSLDEIVYAVAQDSGLFRSRDGGASWELIMIDIGHANRLEVDPTNRDRLYIAKPRNVRGTEGLYQSEDGGDTWTRMPSLIPEIQTNGAYAFVNPHNGTLFGALSADPLGPTCEYGCGLFRFDETLQIWIRLEETGLLDETTPVSAVGFDPDDLDTMYAGLVGGLVLKSVDGGETWSSLGQTPSDYIKRLVVNRVDGTPWAGCSVGQLHGGLYRYDGTQWSQMYNPPGYSEVKEIIFDLDATDVQTQHIWIAAAQDGVLKSEDGGVNWASISPVMSSDTIALNPGHPLTIYSGGTEGVAKTVNGGTSWDFTNEGLTGVVPYRLVVSPHDPAVVYSVADCIGTFGSNNGGKTWAKLLSFGNGPIVVDPDDPRHVVMASGNEILIADDGWNFARQISIPLPLNMEPYMASGSTAMVARSGTWLMGRNFTDTRLPSANYDGGGAIYLSPDGEDWTLTSPIFNCPPTSLAFDPVDENIFYAVTSGFWGGIDCGGGAILRSTDGGQTWQESAAGIPSGFETHLLVVEPAPPYRIFLDTPFVSYDQGATWNETNNRPDSGPIISMLFLEGAPSALYIGASAGIFRSMDAGQTWQRAAGALGELHIYALTGIATPDRHIVYAATVGGAVEIDATQTGRLAQSNETLVNAGVYRYTTGSTRHQVYLPLLFRAYGP